MPQRSKLNGLGVGTSQSGPRRATLLSGLVVSVVLWAGVLTPAPLPAQDAAARGALSPWVTGGTVAQPGSTDGKPAATLSPPQTPAAQVADAYPMPGTVIQGGAIPPGWQPQAIPYSALGPDGKPVTMFVAPTYTFTYQVGPPVALVAPSPPRTQVNRIQAQKAPSGVAGVSQPAWNYQGQGASPAVAALPAYTRSSLPYQYPAGAAALAGTPLVPPATAAAPQPTPFVQPAPQYATGGLPSVPPAPLSPQSLAAPPSQWVAAPTEQTPPNLGGEALASAAPPVIAGAAGGAAIAASRPETPSAAIAPPAAANPTQMAAADPRMTPVSQSQSGGDPAPPQPAPQPTSNTPASGRSTNVHVWRVVGVHDGDTVTCLDETNNQQKVRLAEIDAPELGQDSGKVSREALAEMVFGKTVTVTDDGKDRYGRWIAHMSCNGTDVNRRMVATGNAWHYADYSRDEALATLQTQAQSQRLGLWAQQNPIAPWDYRKTVKAAAGA